MCESVSFSFNSWHKSKTSNYSFNCIEVTCLSELSYQDVWFYMAVRLTMFRTTQTSCMLGE